MSRFAYDMGISGIEFKQNVTCMCPIGGQYCTYQISVSMEPSAVIPDYIEVGRWMGGMNGKEYTIEDAVATVFIYICDEYEPYNLEVKCYCDDAPHMPVTVRKCGGYY